MLNVYRCTVRHNTQNIQSDCHQWIFDSFRVLLISFLPGLCPGPHWGSLQLSTDPLAGLRGHTSNGGRGTGERERKRERRRT